MLQILSVELTLEQKNSMILPNGAYHMREDLKQIDTCISLKIVSGSKQKAHNIKRINGKGCKLSFGDQGISL